MRTWNVLVVAILVSAFGVTELLAHERTRDRRHRGGFRVPCIETILAEFDTDGDGELNEEERAAVRQARGLRFDARHAGRVAAIVEEFDADGDGELSDDERAAAREARVAEHEARRAERRAAILEAFDTDGNGELSDDERSVAREARHAEREARRAERRAAILEAFDADGNGELDEDEIAAAREARCADDDGDGESAEGEGARVLALDGSSPFIRGDANIDNEVDVSDSIAVLGFLFLGETTLPCMDAADANDDGAVDVSDPAAILTSLFLDASGSIPAPYPDVGRDSTPDELTCQ